MVMSRPAIHKVATLGTVLAAGICVHTAVNLHFLRRPQAPEQPTETSGVLERVSILIPARNEARHIEQTVRSALAQRGLADLEVIILDDGSSDLTASIVESIGDPRLSLLRGPDTPPPPRWLGKPWACARLAESASGSILIFVDADVALNPDAALAAITELRANDFSLVAPYPRQLAEGLLERMVQPLVTWSWVATMPLRWAERSHRPSLSAANGQFLVFDAAAYRSIGGHRAVRSEVVEDVALMRALKISGHRTATVDGSHLAQCRMYEGTREVTDGYAKSLWSAFGGPSGSVAVNALLFTAFVVPPAVAILARNRRTKTIGLAGYAAGVTSRALVSRRTGERTWPDTAAQPLSILAFNALNIVSWTRHRRGSNTWKGRSV